MSKKLNIADLNAAYAFERNYMLLLPSKCKYTSKQLSRQAALINESFRSIGIKSTSSVDIFELALTQLGIYLTLNLPLEVKRYAHIKANLANSYLTRAKEYRTYGE